MSTFKLKSALRKRLGHRCVIRRSEKVGSSGLRVSKPRAWLATARRLVTSSDRLGDLAMVAIKAIARAMEPSDTPPTGRQAEMPYPYQPGQARRMRVIRRVNSRRKVAKLTRTMLVKRYHWLQPPKPQKVSLRDLQVDFGFEVDEACLRIAAETKSLRAQLRALAKKQKIRIQRLRGLQYAIRLEVRKTERKLRFARKAAREVGGNTEHFPMRWIRRLHAWVLRDALDYLRECLEVGSSKAAEVWAWIDRRGTDEEFSFETCLRIASEYPEIFDDLGEEFLQMDPDVVRQLFANQIRQRFGAVFPHRQLLKAAIVDAEMLGDENAIRWITSSADTPLSFVDCCTALGFDPQEARQSISLPQAVTPQVAVAA